VHGVGVQQALERRFPRQSRVDTAQHIPLQRSAVTVSPVVLEQRRAERPVRIALQSAIDGRHDAVAPARGVGTIAGDHLGPHHLGYVRSIKFHGWHVQLRLNGRGQGGCVFGLVDKIEFKHAPEDVSAAFLGPARVRNRVQLGRGLGNARQRCCLGHGQAIQALAEIHFCRRRHPVSPLTKKDLVQVEGENVLLGESLLDLQGQKEFLGLADEGPLRREKISPCQLLGYRAAALGPLPREQEVRAGPYQSLVVKPGVFKEAVIFGREYRVHYHFGDVGVPDRDPAELTKLGNETPVTGIDPERHLEGDVPHAVDRWKPRGQEIPGGDSSGPRRNKQGQRDAEQPQKSPDE
jgi:hypothetical protein